VGDFLEKSPTKDDQGALKETLIINREDRVIVFDLSLSFNWLIVFFACV